jgi:hypothetical protein
MKLPDLRWSVGGVFFIASILIALWLIFQSTSETSANPAGQIPRDMMLFVCSSFMSWMTSAWFAKKDGSDKIDAIAERSFEKMAMLTMQVERIKKYLVDTIKLSQSEAENKGLDAGLERIVI